MNTLKAAEEWEKLEIRIKVLLRNEPAPKLMDGIGDVTLELTLSRPPALQRFENPCVSPERVGDKLKEVCNRARARRLPSEPQKPPYAFVHPSLFLSVLTPSGFPFIQRPLPGRWRFHTPPRVVKRDPR